MLSLLSRILYKLSRNLNIKVYEELLSKTFTNAEKFKGFIQNKS